MPCFHMGTADMEIYNQRNSSIDGGFRGETLEWEPASLKLAWRLHVNEPDTERPCSFSQHKEIYHA